MLFDPNQPDAFWLDVTNAALGVFCLVCFLAIGWGAFRDLQLRARQRSIQLLRSDAHSHFDPALGASMADGGRPIDEQPKPEPPRDAHS